MVDSRLLFSRSRGFHVHDLFFMAFPSICHDSTDLAAYSNLSGKGNLRLLRYHH